MTDYKTAGYVGDEDERTQRALNLILNNQPVGRIVQPPRDKLGQLGFGRIEHELALMDKLVEQGKIQPHGPGRYTRLV